MIQGILQLMKKARLNINQSGFSVVEIIVASALFALIVTAFTGSLLYFNKSAIASGTQARAVFLAKEGLEVTRNIRDEDFSNLINGTYGLTVSGGQWIFSGTEDIVDIFTRQVEISTVDVNTKQINSTVSWGENSINSGNVSLITYLTYWRKIVVFDSCSAYCQSVGYTDGTCRQNEKKCGKNGEIYEVDGDQYCIEGPQTDTCCCAP